MQLPTHNADCIGGTAMAPARLTRKMIRVGLQAAPGRTVVIDASAFDHTKHERLVGDAGAVATHHERTDERDRQERQRLLRTGSLAPRVYVTCRKTGRELLIGRDQFRDDLHERRPEA